MNIILYNWMVSHAYIEYIQRINDILTIIATDLILTALDSLTS